MAEEARDLGEEVVAAVEAVKEGNATDQQKALRAYIANASLTGDVEATLKDDLEAVVAKATGEPASSAIDVVTAARIELLRSYINQVAANPAAAEMLMQDFNALIGDPAIASLATGEVSQASIVASLAQAAIEATRQITAAETQNLTSAAQRQAEELANTLAQVAASAPVSPEAQAAGELGKAIVQTTDDVVKAIIAKAHGDGAHYEGHGAGHGAAGTELDGVGGSKPNDDHSHVKALKDREANDGQKSLAR